MRKLRALWSLVRHRRGRRAFLRGLLDHEHESVRAWAIRLLTDALPIDTIFSQRVGPDVELPADLLAKLTAMARDDRSGLVRLVLASTLQRLPVNRRAELARALLSHAEDASDHNLPALIWTGLIPVADADPEALASLASECRLPERGPADRPEAGGRRRLPTRAAGCLADLLRGPARGDPVRSGRGLGRRPGRLAQGKEARGLGRIPGQIRARQPIRSSARVLRELNVLFGDGRALEEVRRLALDEHAELEHAEGRAADLDREPAARPAVDLRAAGARPLPERHRRPRDSPSLTTLLSGRVAGSELPVVPPVGAAGGTRCPCFSPGFRPGPPGPDRRRQDPSRRPHAVPRPADLRARATRRS